MRSPAVLYVDVRCFQDFLEVPDIARHSAAVLRARLHSGLRDVEAVGLVDQQLPPLPAEIGQLLDRVTFNLNPSFSRGQSIYLDLSPLTHDLRFGGRFSGHENLVRASFIYDFLPLDWPGYPNTVAARIEYFSRIARLKSASLLFPVSQYAAKRMRDLVNLPADLVHVTGHAIPSSFFEARAAHIGSPPTVDPGQLFFVVVGTSDPRKNTVTAVKAVSEFNRRSNLAYGLTVLGEYTDRAKEQLIAEAQGGVTLRFLDKPTSAQLVAVYSASTATICPSHMEGAPGCIIEAAICGSPVIASSCAAYAELISDPESLFGSTQPLQLTERLLRIVRDHEWRQHLVEAQRSPVSAYHEAVVGERVWSAIQQELKSRLPLAFYVPAKVKLSILTPLPPDASDGSRLIQGALAELGRLADVDVYTGASRPIEQVSGVRDSGYLSHAPYHQPGCDAVIAALGNASLYHGIHDLFSFYGGPCILHELNLTQMMFDKLGLSEFALLASGFLGRTVDPVEAETWLLDQDRSPTWFVEAILERAAPLFVHSVQYAKMIEERFAFEAKVLPFPPIHNFSEEEIGEEHRRSVRARFGWDRHTFAVCTFDTSIGEQTTSTVQAAIRRLRALNKDVQLVVAGVAVRQPGAIEEAPEYSTINLDTRGNPALYRDILIAADAAVQLQTTDPGRPSTTLADCISAALPTLVSQSLAETCAGPGYVSRVSDLSNDREVADALGDISVRRPVAIY
ncbi:MAG: glycosyltransferase [Bryobacteraceae bacterium]